MIKLVSHSNESDLVIAKFDFLKEAECTKADLKNFVRENINGWVELVSDSVNWTHEIDYRAKYDSKRKTQVFDDDATVSHHTNKLIGFILEDFGIWIQ